ncbi:KH domain-containing protein HEN4 [Malania oleifera]|uniref:KH domain-containing protein HEN4 n=1 Tax=Malania oleifera TaxID=397392 RepID=UPI0025AEA574|nr:KH domain-containing protein HEN4 [Malania oleifera]
MEGSFLSPPAKRSIYTATGMSELSPYAPAATNGSYKRSRPRPPPLTVPAGHVAFRLLCHSSRIGGVIGKSGTIIKQLQQDTAAKIRVQEALPSSDDRVIIVIASSSLNKMMTLSSSKAENNDGAAGQEALEVSAAQEALIRVFERILDVAAETDGDSAPPGGVVSCRLLAEASQAGSVIGKGGKVIENIRKDSGCKIRVLSGEKLPSCAGSNDELVEIEGDILGVKKALVAVSRRLQDCLPVDKTKKIGSRHVEANAQEALLDPRVDLSQRSSVLQPKSSNPVSYSSGGRPLSFEADRVSVLDRKTVQQEVIFRILCSNDKVGGVIGKGGTIVRALQNETGASISVGASIAECDERLITVTASENPELRYSPAQNAIVLVFARSVEAGIEKGLDSGSNKATVSARLVVPSNQAGCLLGKGGVIISEMRRATGAGIRILGGDQLPKCVVENDEVVQISGEFVNVQDALCRVTGRLRDNLFPNTAQNGAGIRSNSSAITDISPYGRVKDIASLGIHTSLGPSHSLNQQTSLARSMDHLGLSHGLDRPASPPLWSSQSLAGLNLRVGTDVGKGLTSFKGGLELGSGSKTAIVTNTTVEIVVPENVIGSVYGENGSNLTRLRQISGAKVIVHEPRPGASDRLVVISGTPDETQAAQSLLQAFILTGRS